MITSEEFRAWLDVEMDKLEAAALAKFGEEVNMMLAIAMGETGGQGTTSTLILGDETRFVMMGQNLVAALAESVADCLMGGESGKIVDKRQFKKREVN